MNNERIPFSPRAKKLLSRAFLAGIRAERIQADAQAAVDTASPRVANLRELQEVNPGARTGGMEMVTRGDLAGLARDTQRLLLVQRNSKTVAAASETLTQRARLRSFQIRGEILAKLGFSEEQLQLGTVSLTVKGERLEQAGVPIDLIRQASDLEESEVWMHDRRRRVHPMDDVMGLDHENAIRDMRERLVSEQERHGFQGLFQITPWEQMPWS